MAAPGITVLKHNVPWGPFTRAQIDEALARGDFTLTYLAHASCLKEWLPLGEVLDYVTRQERVSALPPIPATRDLPPIPSAVVPVTPLPHGPVLITTPIVPVLAPVPVVPIMPQPPTLPPAPAAKPAAPAPPKPQAPPQPQAPAPVQLPEPELVPASFFPRAVAFLVDCGLIFSPVVIYYVLSMLSIEVPRLFRHTSAEAISEQQAHLWLVMKQMSLWLAVGCGWLYGAWYESSRTQATIGKRWMELRVVDEHGERMSFLRATGRYAAKYLSALPFLLGFIMALFSSRGLALHDRLARTRVVRE